jgi:membrane-bound lytic murein transglycosylase A
MILALGALAACEPPPVAPEGLRLSALSYDDLPGWTEDDPRPALAAFRRSCGVMLTRPPNGSNGPGAVTVTAEDWRAACDAAAALAEDVSADETRRYFQDMFRPFAALGPDGDQGLFTGYFEIEVRGARARQDGFGVPIYKLPDDHVIADLGVFDPEMKGRELVGRVENGRFVPYHTRGDIEGGALGDRGFEMLWIDDPVDVFMLHVQGSGRVVLPDDGVVRVGFAGHNGHDYASIGRALIERGEISKEKASWGGIRGWIDANPDKAAALFAENPRFIFFRFLDGIPPEAGPLGPMGLPVWLDTNWPNDEARPLRRLMVAQDAGGAIKGPVRGDFFWGYGADALAEAGKMRSRGRYFILLPLPAAARLPQS